MVLEVSHTKTMAPHPLLPAPDFLPSEKQLPAEGALPDQTGRFRLVQMGLSESLQLEGLGREFARIFLFTSANMDIYKNWITFLIFISPDSHRETPSACCFPQDKCLLRSYVIASSLTEFISAWLFNKCRTSVICSFEMQKNLFLKVWLRWMI